MTGQAGSLRQRALQAFAEREVREEQERKQQAEVLAEAKRKRLDALLAEALGGDWSGHGGFSPGGGRIEIDRVTYSLAGNPTSVEDVEQATLQGETLGANRKTVKESIASLADLGKLYDRASSEPPRHG
jgi:hypothetical protein